MRLGFVGVGKHARRLRDAFSECGASIIAHDRETQSESILDGFGQRMPWREMVTSAGIDAIVCCAPPEVTREVTLACAEQGRRLVATKPLLALPGTTFSSKIYVDLWRLYSPAWLALKSELQGCEIRSVHVDFYGNGPVRSTHSGLLDYGPHALAFVLDLMPLPEMRWENSRQDGREVWIGDWHVTWLGYSRASALTTPSVRVRTGNGFSEAGMRVLVGTDSGELQFEESRGEHFYQRHSSGVKQIACLRDLALRNFCRAFLAGDPSDTLRINCEAMRLLLPAEATLQRSA